MKGRSLFPLVLLGLLAFAGCSKSAEEEEALVSDGVSNDCSRLRSAIIGGKKDEVKQVFSQLIYTLPSRKYTKENIESLVNVVNGQCGNPVTLLCYDCVQTAPAQSELSITFASGNAVTTRVIDLSRDTDGNIVFYNMHN